VGANQPAAPAGMKNAIMHIIIGARRPTESKYLP
jgi:hypothetical protein